MASFDPDQIDWKRLEDLRDGFLARGGRLEDYWKSADDLELYDATFGRRIAWKWRAVLDELAKRDFPRANGVLLDWGAGTAIATREWLAAFGAKEVSRVVLHDRAKLALDFAVKRMKGDHPKIAVERSLAPPSGEFGLVLASHVINELDANETDALVAVLRRSQAFVWLEAGSHEESRALSAVRDRMLDEFEPVAPCTHRETCGVLAVGRERDWCHFFAEPPQEVYTERAWALFGKRLGIDLRSLTYSFIAMRRRTPAPTESIHERVLGRPRVEKGFLRILSCAPVGVRELIFKQRRDKRFFRALQSTKDRVRWARWTLDDGEIMAVEDSIR